MYLVKNEPPIQGHEAMTGTGAVLLAILMQHPEHSKYEFQVRAEEFREILDTQKELKCLELSDDDFSWLTEKMKTANYTGMSAGKVLRAFSQAEQLKAQTR